MDTYSWHGLTLEERERQAHASGDYEKSELLTQLMDAQAEIDRLTEIIEIRELNAEQ